MRHQPAYKARHGFVEEESATHYSQVFKVAGMLLLIYLAAHYIFKVNEAEASASMRGIFAVSGLFAMLFCFMNIELATTVFVFVIPLTNYRLPELPFFLTIADAYIIILTTAWLMRLVVSRGERIRGHNLDRLIFIFIILSLVSMFGSGIFSDAIVELLQTIEYFVISYFLFQNIIRRREELNNVMLAISLAAIAYSCYGIFQYIAEGGGSYRVVATFGHFNAYGAYLALMIPLYFNLALTESLRWRRMMYIITIFTCSVAIMFTFSRGAWIGVLGALVFSAWLRGMGQFVKVLSLLTVMVIIMSVSLPERFIGRAASITEIDDLSTQNRIKQYTMAFKIMTENPFFGVGLDELGHYAAAQGTAELGEIHNLFLYVAAERGIPAMMVLVLIIIVFFNNMMTRAAATRSSYFRGIYVALFSAIVSYMIVNLTAYQLVRGLGNFIGIFFGLSVAAQRIEEHLILTDKLEEDPDQSVILRTPALIGHVTSRP
jgi:O-antigen ligase